MKADLAWSLEPGPIVAAVLVAGAYVYRWRRVRAHDGARAAPVARFVAFQAGVLVALLALISPLDSLADQLFVMHMTQHILLLDVAPILGLLGCTRALLRPVTRATQSLERRAPLLMSPWFALAVYVIVVWVWHIPACYDGALRHPNTLHLFEHVTFLAAGSMYWWHVLSPVRGRLSRGSMGPVLYMAITKVLVGALGMGLAFDPHVVYPYYKAHAGVWGLTTHTDQSIAGLVMALEQSIIMGCAVAWLFMRALAESEREQARRDRYEEAEWLSG